MAYLHSCSISDLYAISAEDLRGPVKPNLDLIMVLEPK